MPNETTINPTSDAVAARHSKTELEPSAPAILPAKVSDDIATIADAEAGASLDDFIVSSSSTSETQKQARADSTDSAATQSSTESEIGFAADAEAGASLTEIMPTREN